MRNNNYYRPLVIALILHAAIILLLLVHFDSRFTTAEINAGQNVRVIKAHTVMEKQVVRKVEQKIKKQRRQAKPKALPVKKAEVKSKQVAFKSKIKPKTKPVKKVVPKPKPTKLTEAERMKALSEKLKQQARSNLQKQVQTEQKQLDKQLAQVRHTQGVVDKYKALILQQVGQNWLVPEVNKDISCRLLITLAPGGTVLSVKLVKSSGNAALDRSAQQAVYKASPLPVPKDSAAFNAMRQLDMIVRPESAVSKVVNN